MAKKINKSKGAISSTLLILGVVLLIVIVGVFVIIQINAAKANKTKQTDSSSTGPAGPVYQTQLGDVKFTFISATDIGNVLKSKDSRYAPDLVTTEKFIKVVVGAQNKGKVNIKRDTWNIGNLVDSEGRNFVSVNDNNQNFSYLSASNANTCGSLLKPEFSPTPCEKYYEVSKASTGFKIEVDTLNENSTKVNQKGFIDLIVR